ncbi:DsbA family oxidoreductase [Haematobacter massiliensis]|uniref:Polyketide biosynthesis protein n=1 Tax=Haematobacter massiliensis TaxID=195105 RepID=A0A086YBY0_9RHOB|nr:DsbA family oxidoreductase [Haematobacter massiliensis]KFI31780.1 polyketide biosynthesis protein [Haematobacter massiliensis]OWJ72164.1 DsbA family oxidoreductase [Haematobacter massiliensis]OWJ87735.1 DsbA family oxidoreductase [Haematobacter massiliensis]QBJ24171.1 DsbA family oxidoreductase [Haematobacter massiliensis]
MVTLDIISDLVCPWCYIGKTLLDRALESDASQPFTVAWHPYQLNPEIPEGGIPYADFLRLKFGAPERASEVLVKVTEAAKAAGAVIDYVGITREPNTLDAHRLIHWAGLEGRQTPVVSALFRAHWREGRDIGSHDVLADIAGETGLDRKMILRLLDSDADREEIRARIQHTRDRGVQGVPTFVIADTHVLTGAQPVEVWADVIQQIKAQLT